MIEKLRICCIKVIGLGCSGPFKTKGHREVPLAPIWPDVACCWLFGWLFAPEQLEF
jgi:hypothetical protein